MNTSQLLIATACSLVMAGTASVAVAQSTTPSSTTQNQNQTQGPLPTTTTTPSSTTPGTMSPTMQRPGEAATGTDTMGNPGTTSQRSTDGSLRTPAERLSDERAMRSTERAARADRN